MRNAKARRTIRAEVDVAPAEEACKLLKVHCCELCFAVWADRYNVFLFLESNHRISPISQPQSRLILLKTAGTSNRGGWRRWPVLNVMASVELMRELEACGMECQGRP